MGLNQSKHHNQSTKIVVRMHGRTWLVKRPLRMSSVLSFTQQKRTSALRLRLQLILIKNTKMCLTMMNMFTIVVQMLEEQLGQERRRTTLDFSDRDFKMKTEYEKRLKSELKGLRKKYKQETERTKKEFTNLHLKKVGLANALDKINRNSSDR